MQIKILVRSLEPVTYYCLGRTRSLSNFERRNRLSTVRGTIGDAEPFGARKFALRPFCAASGTSSFHRPNASAQTCGWSCIDIVKSSSHTEIFLKERERCLPVIRHGAERSIQWSLIFSHALRKSIHNAARLPLSEGKSGALQNPHTYPRITIPGHHVSSMSVLL